MFLPLCKLFGTPMCFLSTEIWTPGAEHVAFPHSITTFPAPKYRLEHWGEKASDIKMPFWGWRAKKKPKKQESSQVKIMKNLQLSECKTGHHAQTGISACYLCWALRRWKMSVWAWVCHHRHHKTRVQGPALPPIFSWTVGSDGKGTGPFESPFPQSEK